MKSVVKATHRRHDIDALRVVLLALLILHHVGSLYTGWDWFLGSSYHSKLVGYLLAPTHLWRMSLLFMISGVALNFLQRRSHADGLSLLATRSVRLVIPLVFGVVFIVPIQPYCQGVWHQRIEPGFGRFLADYFTGKHWPAGTFYGAEQGFATGQLWYLLYLWTYTLVLALALPLLDRSPVRRIQQALCGLRGWPLLLVPAIPKLLALRLLANQFPARDMLLDDWTRHLGYFSFFLFGFLVASDEGFWARLRESRRWMLALCVALWLLLSVCNHIADRSTHYVEAWLAASDTLTAIDTWAWMAAVLGWSATLLNRPFKWLPYATQAIFPWYMLHQTIIVGVAFLLVPMKIGPVLEPALIMSATLLGCGVLHEFAIRRSALLRILFGMKMQRDEPRAGPAAAVPSVPAAAFAASAGSGSPPPAGTSDD